MKKYFKKNIDNGNNKILIIGMIISFFILIFKELISTYLSFVITLIPTIFVFVYFVILFFKGKIKLKKYDYVFALMLLIGMISGIIHNQRLIAILYQIKSLGIYYLLYMIIRSVNIKKEDLKLILKVLNATTLMIICFSIIEILGEKTILFPKEWAKNIVFQDNYIRSYSLICNPNLYAFYLLFVMLYNYKFKNLKYDKKNSLFYMLCILGIILSVSRSALICLIGLVIALCIKLIIDLINKKENKKSIIYLALIIIIPICLSNVMYQFVYYNSIPVVTDKGVNFDELNLRYSNDDSNDISNDNNTDNNSTSNVIEGNTTNNNSNNNQEVTNKPQNNENKDDNKIENVLNEKQGFLSRILDMWESKFIKDSLKDGRLAVIVFGVETVKDDLLFGTGFSSFLTASSFLNPNSVVHTSKLKYADNQYISLLVETGVVGLLVCLVFAILYIFDLIKEKKYISIIMTFVFLFFGLFINVLEVQLISFIYFLFVGLDKEKKYD